MIVGHKVMYKGTGTINGEGNYGFMISAIDEKLTPSTDANLFRSVRLSLYNHGSKAFQNLRHCAVLQFYGNMSSFFMNMNIILIFFHINIKNFINVLWYMTKKY